MNPNLLWLIPFASFAALETLGNLHLFGLQPLTYWLRWAISHGYSWLVSGGLGFLVFWLGSHLFIEPLLKRRRKRR